MTRLILASLVVLAISILPLDAQSTSLHTDRSGYTTGTGGNRTVNTYTDRHGNTTGYFERLAHKEIRDEDRRQRLLEVAGFYRALAGAILGMPKKYKNNGVGLPLTRAARWHARAEECRTLAGCFTDPICRGQL